MDDRPWRRFISIFTANTVETDTSDLIASIESAFSANGFQGPYNTATNAPDGEKGGPTVKVETADGEAGLWIGNHLIFIPISSSADTTQLLNAVRSTEQLAELDAIGYSLSSSKINYISSENASRSTNTEIKALIEDPNAQEFSKNFAKKISNTLTAKDIISISRSEADGLLVDISIRIESSETVVGRTVGDLLSQVETDFIKLKAHEDDVAAQAANIIGQ